MRILAPADSAAEAAELAALGAAELYAGFAPARWTDRFGLDASPNRRSFPEAQVPDDEGLRALATAARAGGAALFVALNAPVYARSQYPALLDLAADALDAGAGAFIAADPGFFLEARRRWPGVRIHVSTLADVANSAAVAFWRRLGAGRITLPRHLTLARIEALVAASPGARFDAFVLYGQCANDEAQCTFSHDHPRRVWPCAQSWRIGHDGSAETERAAAAQAGWAGMARGEACGLCALWDLDRLGVEAAKIVGRGTSTERKRWGVRTVAELIAMIRGGVDREAFRAAARERSRERFSHGCSPWLCYFPELIVAGG